MPAILVTILTAFLSSFIAKILLGAGLAYLSYTWINDLVLSAQQQMQGLYSNLPSDVIAIFTVLQIPQSLSILISAIGLAAFIKSSKLALGKAG